MYRIWYSTESLADFIIDNTDLSNYKIIKNRLYESDISKPNDFHKTPDHIRKILYLDACDLIVEKDNEPVFSIEISTEAGTGHNAFQRFARIAASVENNVPALYVYPEAIIIKRNSENSVRWDEINPLIFRAMEAVMNIYQIPALLYYFPSDFRSYRNNPMDSPNYLRKGLNYDKKITKYAGCPDSGAHSINKLFGVINEIIDCTEKEGVHEARKKLIGKVVIREQRNFMQNEFSNKSKGRSEDEMSPLTAVNKVPTEYLLNYLSRYENKQYKIGELLRSRSFTLIYQINAKFRGDPYAGALTAIDYLKCREGKTFEDRKYNLVLLFGVISVDDNNHTIVVSDKNDSTIEDLFSVVKNCDKCNLLTKDYTKLKNKDIPRYFMQLRYGSMFSKAKHIRVFSYFADAILFPDGSLWRDA